MAPREPETTKPAAAAASTPREFAQSILFTGHMIDAASRVAPRFPARAEPAARAAIRAAVLRLQSDGGDPAVGIAGGASGGDLLFHEVCAELGVTTRLRLALPADQFLQRSVAPAGKDWVLRFQRVLEQLGPGRVSVMTEADGLLDGATKNIWQRANRWMIEEALRLAPRQALLALWDGKGGDGPGGTEQLVREAARFGIRALPPIVMQSLYR
jgi:hypothetical protein